MYNLAHINYSYVYVDRNVCNGERFFSLIIFVVYYLIERFVYTFQSESGSVETDTWKDLP